MPEITVVFVRSFYYREVSFLYILSLRPKLSLCTISQMLRF